MQDQRRTVRFPFSASAEVALESSPRSATAATVKELSLYGCYLETRAPFGAKTPVLVKIFGPADYFETTATVVYAHPASGMGLSFRDVKPDFRTILQKWLLAAMRGPS
jgi:hypothetical protein